MSSNSYFDQICAVTSIVFLTTMTFAMWQVVSNLRSGLSSKERENIKKRIEKLNKCKGRAKINVKSLNKYELQVAERLVLPEEISVSWKNIAGLDDIVKDVRENILYPVQYAKLFAKAPLSKPSRGVLFSGPPGCGKTMIAKAIAKECEMQFINVDAAAIKHKYYGESEQSIRALFTLAQKIQPCIIFFDEIDALLNARNDIDHSTTTNIKTIFMTMCDGLGTDDKNGVIVVGATNRPEVLDRAVLRRLPKRIKIDLPIEKQRFAVLELIMKKENIASDVDVKILSQLTEGFSCSDIQELGREASVHRIRKFIEEGGSPDTELLPPITMEDFKFCHKKMKEGKDGTDSNYGPSTGLWKTMYN